MDNNTSSLLQGIAASVGGFTNSVGQFVTASTNRGIAKEQLRLQKEENEKNRQYNAEQAAITRQFNADQADLAYNRVLQQNQYNTPLAQMQRYREAGLNPNLLYGDFNSSLQMSGGTAASGPAASSSGSVGVGLPDTSGLGNLGTGLLQASKAAAEIKLMKAQADKLNSETDLNVIEKQYKPSLYENTLKLGDQEFKLSSAQATWYYRHVDYFDELITETQNRSQLLAQDLLRSERVNEILLSDDNKDLFEQSVIAPLRESIANAKISEDKALVYLKLLRSQVQLNLSNAANSSSEADYRNLETALNKIIYNLDPDAKKSDYADWLRQQAVSNVNLGAAQIGLAQTALDWATWNNVISGIKQIAGSVSDVLSAVNSSRGLRPIRPIGGFR